MSPREVGGDGFQKPKFPRASGGDPKLIGACAMVPDDITAEDTANATIKVNALRRSISDPRLRGVGEKQLLAVDLVVGDRSLAFGSDQPVDEGLAIGLLDMGVL